MRKNARHETNSEVASKTLQARGDNRHCSPIALDCDVCAVGCFDARHIRAAILDAADEGDLLPCADVMWTRGGRDNGGGGAARAGWVHTSVQAEEMRVDARSRGGHLII